MDELKIFAQIPELWQLLKLLAALSLLCLLLSVLLLPWWVKRLPQDYFSNPRLHGSPSLWASPIRNVFGAVLLLLGFFMLVLPGQGLITMVAGLSLMKFRQKYVLVKRIASLPYVLAGLNKIRELVNKPPFLL